MAKGRPIDVLKTIETLYNAERTIRSRVRSLQRVSKHDLVDVVSEQIQEAMKDVQPREQDAKLMVLLRILEHMRSPRAIDLIIDVLGCESDEANHRASQLLEDLADERLQDLTAAITRATKRLPAGHPALSELPFVVYNLRDVDRLPLFGPFLRLRDPEPVVAALEAIAELMDPSAIPMLEPYIDDARVVLVDEGSGDSPEQLTVGQIAREAIASLREIEEALGGTN